MAVELVCCIELLNAFYLNPLHSCAVLLDMAFSVFRGLIVIIFPKDGLSALRTSTVLYPYSAFKTHSLYLQLGIIL